MNFCVIFDLSMAVIMFIAGVLFYQSNGKAAEFLSGYRMRPAAKRKKEDEPQMCKAYGKRMMYMAIPFLIGALIDVRLDGIGCFAAWGVWLILFILLLLERHKREG